MRPSLQILPLIIVFWLSQTAVVRLHAQWQRGRLLEDLTMAVEPVSPPAALFPRSESLVPMAGFPLAARANPAFKNLRNVTLADLDGDGSEEILWGANNRLFAFHCDTLLWERSLNGIVLYPPSVADLDGDGTLEIVQTTGGLPENGRVYVLDVRGNDRPGWPLSFDDRWMLAAPTLSDLDGDGIREIIVNQNDNDFGWVHVLRPDGTSFSEAWPVALDARPAVTPSTGDFDGDGRREIVIFSTRSRYILGLDGQPLTGWPQTTHPWQRYSFQSPILVDFDDDGSLEIVGATHGDVNLSDPHFFILGAAGAFRQGWPVEVPQDRWTYSTPSVIPWGDSYQIFMGRHTGDYYDEALYGWDPDGRLLPGMPLSLDGGVENVISIGDVDGDGQPELVFGINLVDPQGYGFIFATELDGSGVVPGFPVRPRGLAFLNGAALGDVDGNGTMELAALTFTQNFGGAIDSVYLSVYELGAPYTTGSVLWGTYKGSNTREGLLASRNSTATAGAPVVSNMRLFPNPASSATTLEFNLEMGNKVNIQIADALGRILHSLFQGELPPGQHRLEVPLEYLPSGMYWIRIGTARGTPRHFQILKR